MERTHEEKQSLIKDLKKTFDCPGLTHYGGAVAAQLAVTNLYLFESLYTLSAAGCHMFPS